MLTNVAVLLLLLLALLLVLFAELAFEEALADWPLKLMPSLSRETLFLDVADEAFVLRREAALPGADEVLVVNELRWLVCRCCGA